MSNTKSYPLFVLLGCLACACNGGGGKADSDTDDDGGPDGGPEGVSLDPGDVLVLEPGGGGAFAVDVATSGADERYVLLLLSESRQPGGTWSYEVTVDGAALPAPGESGPWGHDDALLPADHHGWQQALDALRAGAAAATPSRTEIPEVGDMLSFTIRGDTGYVDIDCEVMVVTEQLMVVFDRTTTADLDIDPGILGEVAGNFAGIVLPRLRIYFGEESDVNGDERVTLLYSPLVFTATSGTVAYFFPCDLLDPGAAGCPYSNEQELIYMSPPDLLSPHMGTANAITETLAHEMQHAIYFFRKFLLNDGVTEQESIYINEGMSAMAQDLSGFQAGNLYVAAAAIEQVDDVSMAGVLGWPMGYNQQLDGVWRGAAYLFLRYVFEQAGGESMDGAGGIEDLGGIAFIGAMSNLPAWGWDGVEAAAGRPAEDLIAGMFTAMLLDDRELDGAPLTDDPAFLFQDPWPDPLTGRQRGITMNYDLAGGSWKVRGVPLQQGGADGSIRAGGAEYILIEAPADGGTLAIGAFAASGADLAARLVRIR